MPHLCLLLNREICKPFLHREVCIIFSSIIMKSHNEIGNKKAENASSTKKEKRNLAKVMAIITYCFLCKDTKYFCFGERSGGAAGTFLCMYIYSH